MNMNSEHFRQRHEIDPTALESVIAQISEHSNQTTAFQNEWVRKGRDVLDSFLWEEWDKHAVFIAENPHTHLHHDLALVIMKELNTKGEASMKCAIDILNERKLSFASEKLVISIVECFCDRGKEFSKALRKRRSLASRIASVEEDEIARRGRSAAQKVQTERAK